MIVSLSRVKDARRERVRGVAFILLANPPMGTKKIPSHAGNVLSHFLQL